MKILLDLDNTLVDMCAVRQAHVNLNKRPVQARDWDMTNIDSDVKKEAFRLFRNPVFMNHADPVNGVPEKIQEWSDAGHVLYVLTCRVPEIRKGTVEMVNRYYPSIRHILFLDIRDSKAETFKTVSPDIVIDDAPHYAQEAVDLGIKTYLISNKNTIYNHKYAANTTATVVNSVADINLEVK